MRKKLLLQYALHTGYKSTQRKSTGRACGERDGGIMTEQQKRICTARDAIEESEQDISTEQLFARVQYETGADAGDISEALYIRQKGETK